MRTFSVRFVAVLKVTEVNSASLEVRVVAARKFKGTRVEVNIAVREGWQVMRLLAW